MSGGDLHVAVEDQFVVLDVAGRDAPFISTTAIRNMSEAITRLNGTWRFLWDLREAGSVRGDVLAAYEEAVASWPETATTLLVSPETRPAVDEALTFVESPRSIDMRRRRLPGVSLPFDPVADFDMVSGRGREILEEKAREGYRDLFGWEPPDAGVAVSHMEAYESWSYDLPRPESLLTDHHTESLDEFFRQIAQSSLLTQVAIQVESDRVYVTPYHSHSLHKVASPDDGLVLLRPGRASQRAWQTFRTAIEELEQLLNDSRTVERDIERLLHDNPLFLRGLNFQSVYPQVVLPQAGGGSLRPDVIAEPADSEWSSIVELKSSSVPILVGREGRGRLAHGIHSVVRQLREYRAFFDDRRIAAEVESRYGFKCYQPRLMAIVGRDPAGFGPEETRRAMTTYPDVELVTYDELVRAARRLLLL